MEKLFSYFILTSCIILKICGEQIISTCQDLQKINNNLTDTYSLQNSIDCGGAPLSPIGIPSSMPFSGTLLGNGFMISNFVISQQASDVGLFSKGKRATVQNLTMCNFTVSSNCSYVGSLFGRCDVCTLNTVTLISQGNFSNTVSGSNCVGGKQIPKFHFL